MRAFMALPLQKTAAEILFEKREDLRSSFKKIRWIPPANFHLTLFFFGDITISQVEAICQIMETYCPAFTSFPVEMTGPGQFPPKGKPRVIYESIGKGAEESKNIYNSLYQPLNKIIILEKRKYIPHITLARVHPDHSNRLFSDTAIPLEPLYGQIQGITLFESILLKSGAEYSPVKHIEFREGVSDENR